tara:strand:- start:8627 stop:8857 length:231 start_codon:yes stop_codon:yes gene_type:complete
MNKLEFYILISKKDHKPLAYDPFSDTYKAVDHIDLLKIHDYQYYNSHEFWFSSASEPAVPYYISSIKNYLKNQQPK